MHARTSLSLSNIHAYTHAHTLQHTLTQEPPSLPSINNMACTLAGTTAATCSGYSSLKSGYSVGLHTGPTEITWTSTLSGAQVRWPVRQMPTSAVPGGPL